MKEDRYELEKRNTIGSRLKLLRIKANQSVRYIAVYLNTSGKVIYNIEGDETLPSVEAVISLAKLYGVSTDYILLGETDAKA